jgi:hypothetical protein
VQIFLFVGRYTACTGGSKRECEVLGVQEKMDWHPCQESAVQANCIGGPNDRVSDNS